MMNQSILGKLIQDVVKSRKKMEQDPHHSTSLFKLSDLLMTFTGDSAAEGSNRMRFKEAFCVFRFSLIHQNSQDIFLSARRTTILNVATKELLRVRWWNILRWFSQRKVTVIKSIQLQAMSYLNIAMSVLLKYM